MSVNGLKKTHSVFFICFDSEFGSTADKTFFHN